MMAARRVQTALLIAVLGLAASAADGQTAGSEASTRRSGRAARPAADRSPGAPPPPLRIRHVQNAGVWIRCGGRTVLVDALFDLTVAAGRPPRLHDHLPADSLAAFLRGGLGLGCADAALVTHDHDDHHDPDTARRYRRSCPQVVLALPAALAGTAVAEHPTVAVAVEFGDSTAVAAGPVRFTALGLRHASSRPAPEPRPHLGYLIHLGPWDVLHLGDAAPSPENLALLDRLAGRRPRVVLAPWWFLTEPAGRDWLAHRAGARRIVLLHVNRGNVGEIAVAVATHADSLPPLVLPRSRLEQVVRMDWPAAHPAGSGPRQ
jgi:L-ascorbate metabolism protein UlaG (beta-lactamase superfamily)